jgi:hypothetical protein
MFSKTLNFAPNRRGIPGLLRQLPTRLAVHIGQKTEQERTRPQARLRPPEPARVPSEPRVELFAPHLNVYAGLHGHRSVLFVHNDYDQAVAVPMPPRHPM